MARTHRSARQAGTRFERQIADYLATHLDDRIDRRVKTGALDKGDIAGVRLPNGQKVVIECKDTTRLNLAGWIGEAQIEAANDGAAIGLVAHKRRGHGQPADQYITMTLADLTTLLGCAP
ncbi:hypothetical protein MHT86_08140 [Corynebacterium mastitidis]|uniref:Holliday junction resolvase n=1 Tax=Corynebacterium mastitidis TaxID=161890 RepID=A0A2N0X8U8_9CORY|nr:hypothetical protein [Corynebacterium mastitidis]MCH6197463.1 hypothetical protein [Corynebacterium mastitidis]PKF69136.1 hypothetical protein CXB45_03040 [Corynebacterium mastitidis]